MLSVSGWGVIPTKVGRAEPQHQYTKVMQTGLIPHTSVSFRCPDR